MLMTKDLEDIRLIHGKGINKMEPTRKIKVVVIGGLHHNTLGVIRALGEAGIIAKNIKVILVGHNLNEKNFIVKSKYISGNNISYLEEYNQITAQLMELAEDLEKRVIICCSDGTY